MVKNLPADTGDAGNASSIPGSEDPLEKEMTTHSRTPAWKIPWAEEPGGLQSVGLQEFMTEQSRHMKTQGFLFK